jgi:hypothetical protein
MASVNKDKAASSALARAVKAKDMKAAVRIMHAHGFDATAELTLGRPGGGNCICYGSPAHPTCYCANGDQWSHRD